LSRLVDLDEMLYGRDEIEYDLDSLLFNPLDSTSEEGAPFEPTGGFG
jgi:hypothetical protein